KRTDLFLQRCENIGSVLETVRHDVELRPVSFLPALPYFNTRLAAFEYGKVGIAGAGRGIIVPTHLSLCMHAADGIRNVPVGIQIKVFIFHICQKDFWEL